jgi:serine/threonine-protein kinase
VFHRPDDPLEHDERRRGFGLPKHVMTQGRDDAFDAALRGVADSPEVLSRPPWDPKARVGTVLGGKYRIDAVLGMGGMAVVYRATHRNGAQRAIKVLLPEHSANEDIRRRFRREGRFANAVQHPGAVSVIDDDVTEDGVAFLVLELLEGIACDQLCELSGGRLATSAACAVALQTLDVLQAAHAKGIIHRDIKPANLFVLRTGTVKVLDFGIARVREAVVATPDGTAIGVHLGTPAFMAPEQAAGAIAEIDERTDVWAVGATLFTMLSGAFVGRSGSSLGNIAPRVSRRLVNVIARALELKARERWQSAEAMRSALADASRGPFGEPPGPPVLASLVASCLRQPGSKSAGANDLEALSPTSVPALSAAPSGPTGSGTRAPVAPQGVPARSELPPPLDIVATIRSESKPRPPRLPSPRLWLWLAPFLVSLALLGLATVAALRTPTATGNPRPGTGPAATTAPPALAPVSEEPVSHLPAAVAPTVVPPASATHDGWPHSCAEARAGGVRSDGTVRIDPDGRGPWHPFDVYCAGMAEPLSSAPPREYLTLPHSMASGEPAANMTTYVWRGGPCDCPDLVRWFSRVRLDAQAMAIDPSDGTFASYDRAMACEARHRSQCGDSIELGWGAPGSCRAAGDASGKATIDLRGTPFALAPEVHFAAAGFAATGQADVSTDRKTAVLSGGGLCGVFVPEQGTIALIERR